MKKNLYDFLKKHNIKSTLSIDEYKAAKEANLKMAYAASDDTLNYLGQLYSVGARSTPFLNMIGNPVIGGGLSSRYQVVNSFEFSTAVPTDSGQGTQPAITEDASVTGVAATTKTRGQDTNTCQIFMRLAEVSYKKLSTSGTHQTGLAGSTVDGVTAGLNFGATNNPVQDELDFQVGQNMNGMASDMNYTFLNGSFQLAAGKTTAAKCRGLDNAITTTVIDASSATLSNTMIENGVKGMVDAGAPRQNLVAFCNSYQRIRLGKLYEFVPMDRFVGGSQINVIYTPFGAIQIVYDPDMLTDTIFIVEMSVITVKICPVEGKYMLIEDKTSDGASYKKQIYLQAGLNYGPEEYHCKIHNLATS